MLVPGECAVSVTKRLTSVAVSAASGPCRRYGRAAGNTAAVMYGTNQLVPSPFLAGVPHGPLTTWWAAARLLGLSPAGLE